MQYSTLLDSPSSVQSDLIESVGESPEAIGEMFGEGVEHIGDSGDCGVMGNGAGDTRIDGSNGDDDLDTEIGEIVRDDREDTGDTDVELILLILRTE